MTSREHARRLMLILLSSHGSSESGAGRADEGERADDRQVGDGRDDSPEAGERRTTALAEALVST